MADYEVARRLNQSTNEWETVVVEEDAGGGGLPTGWTQDASNPAGLSSNGGVLNLGSGTLTSEAQATASQYGFFGFSTEIQTGAGDPIGFSSPAGSLYLRTNGQAWLKTGAGNNDWTQLGGVPAGNFSTVRVPITFDMAGLVLTPGVTLYTPAAGEAIAFDLCYMSITTEFQGTNPTLNLTYANLAGNFSATGITGYVDGATSDGQTLFPAISLGGFAPLFANSGAGIFPDASPLKMIFDDGAAGDPAMTAGEGEVVLVILSA